MSSRSRKTKKAKIAQDEEEDDKLWTLFEGIPPEPVQRMVHGGYTYPYGVKTPYQQDQNIELRKAFSQKLSLSLVAAVKAGNVPFVRKSLATGSRTRKLLTFFQHQPQTNYTDAMAHILKLHGIAPPVQPFFGLRELVFWSGERSNLLIDAIRSNQLETLTHLVNLGFDINASSAPRSRCGSTTNPLVVAIQEGHTEIIHFLLEQQPQIILTHPETKLYKTGNGRSRPRCEPTALSVAAERGRLDVVKLLIKKGALTVSSTSRSDDPYSLAQTDSHQADALLRLSINEAIFNAYERAGEETEKDYLRNGVAPQTFADILELLLSNMMGAQEENAISAYILDKIRFGIAYSYKYHVADDRNFNNSAGGTPSARAMAVARGLRTLNPDCLRGVVSESDWVRVKEKYEQWSELVKVCRDRLSAAGPDWMKAVERAIGDDSQVHLHGYAAIADARSRTQMLYWCQLFTASPEPWSRKQHLKYPVHTRLFVRELLLIGSEVDRRNGHQGILKKVWDREIVPFVVD